MLTPFILKLIHFLPFLRNIGVIPLTYNPKRGTFSVDLQAENKEIRNFLMHLVWIGLSAVVLVQFYRSKNFDSLNQVFPLWLVLLLVAMGYSLTTCYPHDTCKLANGIVTFLPYLHSKIMLTYQNDKHV